MKELGYMLWESRIPEFIRVYIDYLKYKSNNKIGAIKMIPIAWCYASMGYRERVKVRMSQF